MHPQERPRQHPRGLIFPAFSPFSVTPHDSSHETSHEGVHGIQNRVRKKGLLEKGSFQKSPSSRDFREFRYSRDIQEWPRQTKPKKGQFMNFSQGHSGTKIRYVNRACFPKEKHQNSQKWAKLMNFSFWHLLWFGLPGRLLNRYRLEGIFHFFAGPPNPYDFLGKRSKIMRTGDFFPH